MGGRIEQPINKGKGFYFGKPGLARILVFTQHLSVMLRSGLTLSEALAIIGEQEKGRWQAVIGGMNESIRSGNTFSDTLSAYPRIFSRLYIATVRAGETTGALDNNLAHIAEELKKEKELKSNIKSAMIYPVIVVSAAAGLGLAIAYLVLPRLTPLFLGMDIDLPASTRVLLYISALIESHGWAILAGLGAAVIAVVLAFRSNRARPFTHWLGLRLPWLGRILRKASLTRFARTLGTSLKSGLTIDEAMEISGRSAGNYYYSRALKRISQSVGQGSSLSESLGQYGQYFPGLLLGIIEVGERSGKLQESLEYLAGMYENEMDDSIKAMTTAIEPILLIAIGVMVGWLALSIITPIYEITGKFGR